MKRRSILLVMLAIALITIAVAPAVAQDLLLIWADGERAPILEELGDDFFDEFGVEVVVQQIGLGEARDQLLVAGPVGEGPDIMIIAHDSIGLLVANGAIVPIDLGSLADDFLPAALNLFTFNGELWGVPYAMENIALVRNVDLVPEAPTTWQEVQAISEELSADGIFGMAIQIPDTYHTYPVISAFGGYIFGRNDDGTFNTSDLGLVSEGGLAAGAWLSDMWTGGFMPQDANDDAIFALFEEGQLAMFMTGPWFSARIVDTGINYSIDPLPGAEGGLDVGAPFSGGQGFVISAFSNNQLLAEQFLFDFVATEDTMQTLFDEGGRIPAFAGVDTSSDPNIEAFIAAGQTSVPMPAIPEMGAVWGASNDALTLISQGEDSTATLENAVVQIGNAIEIVQAEGTTVGLPGSHQAAVGCSADWDPGCETTFFTDQGDGFFTLTLDVPAGDYEYKIALNASWDENYGLDGERDGPNIPLSLAEDTTVTFLFNRATNVVTHVLNTEDRKSVV